jgi:hypothetical protein
LRTSSARGLLRRDPTKPRALELLGRGRTTDIEPAELPRLPLLGQIAAGGPLLADQNVEDEIAVPETLHGDFLLRVKGDSMIEAGILEGDLVVVQRAQDARNGDIVVALAGDDETADEATVKRFFREGQPHPPAAGEQRPRTDIRRLCPDPRPRRGGLSRAMSSVAPLHRSLEQELLAVLRGASARVPVCGEFVLHEGPACALSRVRDVPARAH